MGHMLATPRVPDSKRVQTITSLVRALSSDSPCLSGESGQKQRCSGLGQLTPSIPLEQQDLPGKHSRSIRSPKNPSQQHSHPPLAVLYCQREPCLLFFTLQAGFEA